MAALTVRRPRELIALRRLIEDELDPQTQVKEIPDELIMAAAEACPALAISVLDTEAGKTVFP